MVGPSPKKQDLWPRINILEGKKMKILSMNVSVSSVSKIRHDFIIKVVQKLTLEKNVFNKKWSPDLIFINEKKKYSKNSLIFDIKN